MQVTSQQNNFFRIFDLFHYQHFRYPNQKALVAKENEDWRSYSTEDCIKKIDQVSAGLLHLGLKKGDKVGIISQLGSPQWNFLDFGAQQIGIIVVPIHATVSEDELEYILKDADIKVCFASTPVLYEKVKTVRESVPDLRGIYSLKNMEDTTSGESFLQPAEPDIEFIKSLRSNISENDLATIIYTSGTTGRPKGVMLSHSNIVSNIKSIIPLIPINFSQRTVSYLPLSHIFERMVTYTYIAVGASLHYAEKADASLILDNIREARPHYFTTVPRLLERMHDEIRQQANSKNIIRRKMIRWALKLGEKYKGKKKHSPIYWYQLFWADLFVFRKWRQVLGNHVKGVVVGSAALHPNLSRLFSAARIKIREGYGLTETSPVVAFNRFEPGGCRFGTVGIPIPGVEVKIDDPNEEGEGEIKVKGLNVMMGYYNKPKETNKVISKDGWFRTGDIGKIVHKKFLQITDRKKDIFKTSSGKYIAPQALEIFLKTSPFIERCMIIGFQRSFVTALIIPHFPLLKQWCEENKVHWTSPQYMVHNNKVMKHMDSVLNEINGNLPRYKHIRKHLLLHEEWSVQGGELTPTLKIKRPYLLEKFQKDIEKMYKK